MEPSRFVLRKRIQLITVALATVVPLVGPGVAGTAARAATCTVPTDAAMRRDAPDYLPHEAWVAAAGPQKAIRALNATVARRVGQVSKSAPNTQLNKGFIGSALNHTAQVVVYIVDPAKIDTGQFESQLQEAARQAAQQRGVPELTVDVIAGCFAVAPLVDAYNVLVNRRWAPSAATATFRFFLDPHTSKYKVLFSRADGDAATALKNRLGARVEVTLGPVGRQAGSRMDDGTPHYGGAGLHVTVQGKTFFCTSGFSVILSNGTRGQVTADHCVDHGVNFANRDDDPYGIGDEVPNSFPHWDLARIKPESGHTFTNKIWVDPCSPCWRTVIGAAQPGLDEYLCVSGSLTKAKCGIKVISMNGSVCDTNGCTTALMEGQKVGTVLSVEGDSGAPVYLRSGTSGAIIKGVLVGGDPGYIKAEKWYEVQNHLGVKILTAP